MSENNPSTRGNKRTCTARNRSGKQCGMFPVPGATVCRMHGGAAPQVKKKAALRLLQMVDPAIVTLGQIMLNPNESSQARIRAAENVLDRAGVPRRVETSDPEAAKALLLEKLMEIRANARSDAGLPQEPKVIDGEVVPAAKEK